MGEDDKTTEATRTDAHAPGYVLFPAARRAISSRSIESCTDVSSPPASSDRAGGFGGFKKKGKFGRGNVRKRTKEDDSDEDVGGCGYYYYGASREEEENDGSGWLHGA